MPDMDDGDGPDTGRVRRMWGMDAAALMPVLVLVVGVLAVVLILRLVKAALRVVFLLLALGAVVYAFSALGGMEALRGLGA